LCVVGQAAAGGPFVIYKDEKDLVFLLLALVVEMKRMMSCHRAFMPEKTSKQLWPFGSGLLGVWRLVGGERG
jgi:hypothetical protein